MGRDTLQHDEELPYRPTGESMCLVDKVGVPAPAEALGRLLTFDGLET